MNSTPIPYRKGIVAIIPARGGSKRLPGKNLLPLHGKPLIQWTLDSAIESSIFDHLVVTSDDENVLQIGKEVNALTIKRPYELASDTATTGDTILHALNMVEAFGIFPKWFMLLQPTSPLRSSIDIRNALALLKQKGLDSVVSICKAEHTPLWCNTLREDGSMIDFLPPHLGDVRGQDLPIYYRLNGAIYFSSIEGYRKYQSFFIENSGSLVMPIERSIDIDTILDYYVAETIVKKMIMPTM